MSDRVRVALVCSECGARNYQTTKKQASSKTGPTERLELKKFCSHCDRHTLHRESK